MDQDIAYDTASVNTDIDNRKAQSHKWAIGVIVCSIINIALSVLYICYALVAFILLLAIPPHPLGSAFVQFFIPVFHVASIVIATLGIVGVKVKSPVPMLLNFFGLVYFGLFMTGFYFIIAIAMYAEAGGWPNAVIHNLVLLCTPLTYAIFAAISAMYMKSTGSPPFGIKQGNSSNDNNNNRASMGQQQQQQFVGGNAGDRGSTAGWNNAYVYQPPNPQQQQQQQMNMYQPPPPVPQTSFPTHHGESPSQKSHANQQDAGVEFDVALGDM